MPARYGLGKQTMPDIEIEIDGKKLTAQPNQTVIEVADSAGIYIPRFCYHKQLSIPANCRMCLVEIEKAPKTLPACATPVAPGMKVFTRSPKTLQAQRAVMEFLLINHPLDCPICDQGGECELQDLSMGYGASWSQYDEPKRAVADQDLGPLIATEMTRCIYCTRCVRFGDEVAGIRELGAIGRGEFTEIGTYIQHAIQSELSGNIIDLCPVGALTSKPYRFTARPWELDQAEGISPHDCIGSNLHIHTRYGEVMRVVAHDNPDVNETWIADRDRFSYEGLHHPDRLKEPIAKIDGRWQVVEWEQAFELVAQGLQAVIAEHGVDKLGALASPSSTLEEFYLLQKIIRGLGSPHIDYRLREVDTSDDAQRSLPQLGMSWQEFDSADAIILLGSHIQKEQPIAGWKVRKAALKGASIIAINPVDYPFNFPLAAKAIVATQDLPQTLQAILESLTKQTGKFSDLRQALKDKQRICIVLGALANHHPQAASLRYYAQEIARNLNAKVGYLTDGANAAGGYLAGAMPHRQVGGVMNNVGLSAYAMLEKPRKAYVLLNVEPDKDCANSALAKLALQQAQFVVALATFRNQLLEEHANVILPMAAFTETSGTYVNVCGRWQSFKGCAKPFFATRPAWKILRVLGNFLQLNGFDYKNSERIRDEVKSSLKTATAELSSACLPPKQSASPTHENKLYRIGEIPIYAIDSLVRRSKPLQETQPITEGNMQLARLHPKTAESLSLQTGDAVQIRQKHGEAKLTIAIDERIPQKSIFIAGGIHATRGLGDLFGEVDIEKAADTTR